MEINILLLIILVLMIGKIIDGYKKGMVQEIISFLSLIFLCLTAALILNGVGEYFEENYLNMAVAILMLAIVGIAQYLVETVLIPAKLVSKLPLVKSLDKLMGMAIGAAEIILMLWMVYGVVFIYDTGIFGAYIMQATSESPILIWLYEHNQLWGWAQYVGEQIQKVDYVALVENGFKKMLEQIKK